MAPATKDEEGVWQEIETHEFPDTIIVWDDVKEVTGTLKWRETVPTKGLNGDDRESTMYAILTDNGEVGVWGTANLDPQLAKVGDGARIRIEHTGIEKLSGGRNMRKFKVFVAA